MPFAPGFTATISFGGTDISQYVEDVKFHPMRKADDLAVLGGNPIQKIVGPVGTEVDINGFIDPTVTALFTTHMNEATPTSGTMVYRPQGGTTPSRTGAAFVTDYQEDTASTGPGKWTVKLEINGAVTYA